MRKGAERLRTPNKICLAIYLHHHTNSTAAMRIKLDNPLGNHAIGTLGRHCQASFTHELQGFINIAIGLTVSAVSLYLIFTGEYPSLEARHPYQ